VKDFVTVVTGVPRSGTSMMMQMLEAGGIPLLVDDVRPPDADNPNGYAEYAPVAASARDVSWFAEARGRAVKVVHALVPHLPDEGDLRIVAMKRDPTEVMRSQRTMLDRGGSRGRHQDDQVVTAVFRAQAEATRRTAVTRPRTALLEISYPDVVDDPVAAARRVDAFLGGGLDVEEMAARVDAKLYRNRA
jgi:hypothetical protein